MSFSEIVKKSLNKKILLSPDLLDQSFSIDQASHKLVVLNQDLVKLADIQEEINWQEFDRAKVLLEKNKDPKLYNNFLNYFRQTKKENPTPGVKIVYSYNKPSKSRTVNDFVNHFNARYKQISNMLKTREQLQGLTSINKILNKKNKESASVIGMIHEKQKTKNNNLILTLEDPTGFLKVVVSKNKPEIFDIAKESCLDEVVGVSGTYDNVLFANNYILPNTPLTKELKKSPEEEYAVFIGDPQVGGKDFLEKEFSKLIYWLQGKLGNDEQKKIARKVRYAIIPGDLVEGVGVYPGQENDLLIMDIQQQYEKLAEYLKQIPKYIQIILCPGNHDAGRLAEPQPLLYKDFAHELWNLENVTIVSNPAIVNIGAKKGFNGFNVLIYHGSSMFYYASEIESIRSKGGIARADLIMKYFLQRRHLAPTHTSTVYVPDSEQDPLVIEKIPDFLVTGHVHRLTTKTYKNITMINASAWTGITENQVRRGLEPQPARLPIVNLQTRDIKIMNFLGKEQQEKINHMTGKR